MDGIAARLGLDARKLVKGWNRGRVNAYHYLVDECGMSITRVADEFKVSVSAVSHGLKRLQQNKPERRKRKLK